MQPSRACKILVLAALATGFASVAEAQGINPQSRQAVVGQASGAQIAALKSKQKVLFSKMLTAPADLDIAFEYAALCEQLGDIEGAISTLERMLVFAPGLPRLQYELGILYFRVGAWNAAKSYFDSVLTDQTIPTNIRTDIETYEAQIKQRQEGSRTFAEVTTGVRYQTNANGGPASPEVTLNGIGFTLDPGSLGNPDTNAFGTALFHSSTDLESQGDRFDLDLSAYGALFANMQQFNTGSAEIKAGPNLNLQSIGIDNARLALYGKGGGAILGGDPYYASLGLGADLTVVPDARTRLTFSGEARQQYYIDSPARPNVSDRSGQDYSGSARLDYTLNQAIALFASTDGDLTVAQLDYLSSISATVSAGIAAKIAVLPDHDLWTVTLTGGATHKVAGGPNPVVSLTDAEVQTNYFAAISTTVPLANDFFVRGTASYTLATSNYDMSNYDDIAVSLAMGKRF